MPAQAEARRVTGISGVDNFLNRPMTRRRFGVLAGETAIALKVSSSCGKSAPKTEKSPTANAAAALEARYKAEQDKNGFVDLKSGTGIRVATWTGTRPGIVTGQTDQIQLVSPAQDATLTAGTQAVLIKGDRGPEYDAMLKKFGVTEGKGVMLILSSPALRDVNNKIDVVVKENDPKRVREGDVLPTDPLAKERDAAEKDVDSKFLGAYDKPALDKINQPGEPDLPFVNIAVIVRT